MVFPIAGGTQDTGYEISNSLRFNEPDGAHLSRTPSSAGNRKTWTFSCWIKRSGLQADVGDFQAFFTAGSGSNRDEFFWEASNGHYDKLAWYGNYGGTAYGVRTSSVFRDVSAWYHIVWVGDTTQGTEANRLKLYINGTQQTLTEFNSGFLSQNTDMYFNNTTEHEIGSYTGETQHLAGYMSEIHHIDGQALDPTYFAETNSNGVWIPKEYTGSYGTNGFFMEFKQTGTSANSSGMGADTSGNDHHFTPSNLNAYDVVPDTPTNNFCTLNSLSTRSTLSEGNLKYLSPQGATTSTIAVANGQWYMEFLIVTQGGILSGFVESSYSPIVGTNQPWDHGDGIFYYTNTGQKAFGSSQFSDYAATSTNGDIIGVAIDIDNNTIQFYKNGSALGSISNTFTDGAFYTFVESDATSATNSTGIVNFGHDSSFAGQKTAQNNSDENGYGDFYYTPPSGYYSICTKNLAEFG